MRNWLFPVVVLGLLAGCGGEDGASERKTVYPVTGKITLHGSPLADAMVSFAPKTGQPTAVGRTNQAGEFTLTTYEPGDGAAPGDYAVVVIKVVPGASTGAEEQHSSDPYAEVNSGHGAKSADTGVAMVQPKYGNADETPLTATVKADGDNHLEFQVD
jgi:hypothetical protein